MEVVVEDKFQHLESDVAGVAIKVKDMRLVVLQVVGDEVADEGAD